jgi:hypothetical protein
VFLFRCMKVIKELTSLSGLKLFTLPPLQGNHIRSCMACMLSHSAAAHDECHASQSRAYQQQIRDRCPRGWTEYLCKHAVSGRKLRAL